MMEARLWALGGKDTPPREMTPEEKALKLRQLDARIKERHGEHR